MNYWLMKSEPEAFSIDDLKARPQQTEHWDGVRNYQARNWLRDTMRCGDQALFYHSNCKVPGIVGIMNIVREGYPDFTAFDPQNPHYDATSNPTHPRWYMVDVRYLRHLKQIVTLDTLKQTATLAEMPLVQRGNRLSIMPISESHWRAILALE